MFLFILDNILNHSLFVYFFIKNIKLVHGAAVKYDNMRTSKKKNHAHLLDYSMIHLIHNTCLNERILLIPFHENLITY